MIRVEKSGHIPKTLQEKGRELVTLACLAFEKSPSSYTSAQGVSNKNLKKIEIKNSIYGAKSVKKQLIEEQFGKCCFCESDFTANGHGDVEHFRPKGAYKKKGMRSLTYPGYYWLAYDWENIYFSCQICNASFKGNEFPLFDESKRARNHTENHLITEETPILIHPSKDNPEEFIGFRKEVPYAINNSEKGLQSIKSYGLDRTTLNNQRLEYLELLTALLTFAELDLENPNVVKFAMDYFKCSFGELQRNVENGKKYKNIVATKRSKFTAMIRANFPDLPQNYLNA